MRRAEQQRARATRREFFQFVFAFAALGFIAALVLLDTVRTLP